MKAITVGGVRFNLELDDTGYKKKIKEVHKKAEVVGGEISESFKKAGKGIEKSFDDAENTSKDSLSELVKSNNDTVGKIKNETSKISESYKKTGRSNDYRYERSL